MSKTWGLVWFAARTSFSRHSGGHAANIVLGLGTLLLTFVALAGLAVPVVSQAQSERTHRLTPRFDELADPAPGRLLVDPPFPSDRQRWNGYEVVREHYASSDSTMSIPGVGAAPGIDEYVASPALEGLIARDRVVGASFDGLKRIGTITNAGLVAPDELRAVIGVSPKLDGLRPVDGFGADEEILEDDTVLNRSVAFMVVAMLVFPAAAFLVIVSRLRARLRIQRVESLRRLGLSATAVRLHLAMEAGFVALLGAVVGCLLFNVAVRTLDSVPATSFGYFPEDAALGPVPQTLCVLGIVALAGLAAAASPQRRRSRARGGSASRRLSGRFGERLGVMLLIVGLAYVLLIPLLAAVIGVQAAYGIWFGCAAVAVGLAMVGPRIVDEACHFLAPRVRSAGSLVGVRVGAVLTTTSTRLGSLASVVIVLLLGSMSFTAILNGGSFSSWEDAVAEQPSVPVIVTDNAGGLTRQDVSEIHTGNFAQARPLQVGRLGLTVVFASCASVRELFGGDSRSCTSAPRWLNAAPPSGDIPAHIKLPETGTIATPAPTQVARVTNLPRSLEGALLVSPELSSENNPETFMLINSEDADVTLARFDSRSPGLQYDLGPLQRTNPDFRPYSAQLDWLRFGALLSLLMAALGLVASTLGDASDRSARLRGMRLLGAPTSEIVRAHLWATALPIATLGWVSSFIGWQMTRAMHAFDDRASVPAAAALWCALGSLVVAVLVALVTTPDSLRASRRSGGVQA